MERNKITIAILVSTYALIIIALYLSSDTTFPTNTFKLPQTESQNPSHLVSKCWSPPTKSVTKSFFWNVPADWPAGVYPLCEEWITVYYWNCTEEKGSWVEIYRLETNENGLIAMNLIPGEYKFEWIGDPTSPCCKELWYHEITCAFKGALPDNFVDKVKGGDKAFLFLVNYEYSPLLSRTLEGE